MKSVELKARAKINLGLDVLRKREDGYHEVRMIMQTVPLYDRMRIAASEEKGIRITTNLSFLPATEENLAYRAADLLMKEFGVTQGVDIELHKFIPVAAGMAGGSTDAAAALVGINRLFHLDLSKQELMKRGVKIGADVPFCVMRGTALAEGIGEKLTPLPAMPPCHILIAKPRISVSTKFVYGNLKLDEVKKHPKIDAQIEALEQKDLKKLAANMGNVLETVVLPEYPVIQEIKEHMLNNGALNAMMSGSGPTVFGIFKEQTVAEQACQALQAAGLAKNVYLNEIR